MSTEQSFTRQVIFSSVDAAVTAAEQAQRVFQDQSLAQRRAVIKAIRSAVREMAGEWADAVRILYGGSMNPGNASELMAMSDIDGGLIGGASLNADSFAKIIFF